MKEHRYSLRAVLRGRTKRYLVAVIAIILVLAFSTTALAAKSNGGGTDAQSGATPQNPPNNPNNNGNNNHSNNNRYKAKIGVPNLNKIEKAIASLTDEIAKAELTALLSVYQDAWTAKQDAVAANETDSLAALTDAIVSAKAALDAALETAGVSMDAIYGVPVEALDGIEHRDRRPELDVDKVLAAIATLPDHNADKATLTSLLNAYQEALRAQHAADSVMLREEEMQMLSYQMRYAEEALLLASREAGIIGGRGRGQFVSGSAFGNADLDITSLLTSIASLDDTDVNKATLTTLLEAYTAALTAEAAADKTVLSEAEFEALHDATEAAELALIEALKLAGIEVPVFAPPIQPKYETPSYDDDDEFENEEDEFDD